MVLGHPTARPVVVSDEVYEFMTFDGRQHERIAAIPGMFDRTISLFRSAVPLLLSSLFSLLLFLFLIFSSRCCDFEYLYICVWSLYVAREKLSRALDGELATR